MELELVTPPAIEPVTLSEVKDHLRIDSGGLGDVLSSEQTITAGSHAIAPDYSLIGSEVEVAGYMVLVLFSAGACGAGGSVDVKLQEYDGAAWSDVDGGAFDQVTEENDDAVYELAYTGSKQSIRALGTVAGSACEFGVIVIKRSPVSMEDEVLSGFIETARQSCEGYQNRAYITQVWDLFLDNFPDIPFNLPFPPLQSVTHIKYYDTDGTEYTFDSGDYQVSTAGFKGRISLGYGKTWPSTTLRPMDGVNIRFVAGYGDTAENVPQMFRTAIKLLTGHLYENRESTDIREHFEIPGTVKSLLGPDRVIPI